MDDGLHLRGTNTLEDNCFAFCENTGEKDDEGRTTPKNARHLPHHAKGNGASGAGGTVDLPHLRNALARVNQVMPVTDTISAAELRRRAKAHLVAHAKREGIGDYDSTDTDKDKPNDEEGIMKDFQFKSFGVDMTVSDEKFEQDMKALQDALSKREKELEKSLADLDQKVKDLEEKVTQGDEKLADLETRKEELEGFKKSTVEVFGEEATAEDMRRARDTEKAFRESEIKRALKFGGLIDMIKDQEKELKFYETLATDQISKFADKYFADFEKRNPGIAGVMNMNSEEMDTEPNLEKDKPKEIEPPKSHYKW